MPAVARSRTARLRSLCLTAGARAALGLALLAPVASSAATTVLYDGASGKVPNDPTQPIPFGLCSFAAGFPSCGQLPPGTTQTMSGGAVVLNTLANEGLYAGYLRASPVPLNSTLPGIRISFRMKLEDENHLNNNRAGFSVIALNTQHRGVELGFWEDQIWAQNIVPGPTPTYFVHGEQVAFDTTAGFTDYDLVLAGTGYTLTAKRGASFATLTGTLRDYSPAVFYPYSVNNFLFFGDDTSSAGARVAIASISVTPVPEPETYALLFAGLATVAGVIRQRRRRLPLA